MDGAPELNALAREEMHRREGKDCEGSTDCEEGNDAVNGRPPHSISDRAPSSGAHPSNEGCVIPIRLGEA
jgi:hypothetical protein